LLNLNRTQYRSAIFTYTPEQKQIARKVLDEVQEKHFKGKKIVVCRLAVSGSLPYQTEIAEAGPFYEAEDYHQVDIWKISV